ncbi:hypothetical protein Ancab_014412 [Ancistrocladus abbreviatus]
MSDGKKASVHVATPHPSKQAVKTSANSGKPNQQTPKSGGSFSCNSCNRHVYPYLQLRNITRLINETRDLIFAFSYHPGHLVLNKLYNLIQRPSMFDDGPRTLAKVSLVLSPVSGWPKVAATGGIYEELWSWVNLGFGKSGGLVD